MSFLPIMRPKLPPARLLLPYLNRIDEARIYSNYGPLTVEFENRLAAHFGVPDGAITTIANATLGLVLALRAQGAKSGTLCVIPAWTFIASPQAAEMAGLVPFFADVDASTWALDPNVVSELIQHAPGEVGAVMPVVPFGQPIDVAAWDRFHTTTGIPVVIDAAAGFDSLKPTATPAVVSLHATKAFGIGEGGFVLSTDRGLIRGIRARANFGFHGTREATVASINAKLSEYHAAVGLAALDEWSTARADWLAAAEAYRERLPSGQTWLQPGLGESWVSSVCIFRTDREDVSQLESRLEHAGIETRRWWGTGAHAHPSTRHLPRMPLQVTEQLAHSTIAVPLFRDMGTAAANRVVECVLSSSAVLAPRLQP